MALTKKAHRSTQVREFILNHAQEHPRSVARLAGRTFGISRQSVAKHLGFLVSQGLLDTKGQTRGREYHLRSTCSETFELKVTPSLQENEVWRQKMAPFFVGVTDTIKEICQYGFTEMLSNVMAHSQSRVALVSIQINAVNIRMMVADTGVGIFEKVRREFGTDDARHSLLELSKGKLTSLPDSLAGEGLFFTSWMFDQFSILSGGLCYHRYNGLERWAVAVEEMDQVAGTAVFMDIHPACKRTVQKVLDRHSVDGGGLGFNSTYVPVLLAKYDGEQLVSRSQGKRLLARLDRFTEVYLDFQGVASLGQSFADEIFRVYACQHPEIRLHWINAEAAVTQMIQRVGSKLAAVT